MASTQLHEDLIEEIMARLPIKSLMRFRCLNKAYNTLITKNRFITKHLSHSTSAAKSKPSFLIFHYTDKFSMTLVTEDEQSQSSIDLNPTFPCPDHLIDTIIVQGPSNGIFCLELGILYSPDRLMLWNPATRETKLLPLSLVGECSQCWDFFNVVHGFGFDPNTNDYKVVNITTGMKHGMTESQQHFVQVYNLRSDSWKMVDVDVPANTITNSMYSSYLNGVYHWLTKSHEDESILCFDMSNDAFWKMNLPPVSQDNTIRNLVGSDVAIINDHVAYIKEYMLYSPLATHVEIWVMNEYGLEESWTKRFNIGPWPDRWKFWGFWKDDEVLITGQDDEEPLVLYNINSQRPIKEFPVYLDVKFHAFRYVESVVPLSVSVEEEA